MDERTMKQLEAYLDNLLPEGEMEAFERRIEADAELGRAVAHHRAIEQSMRRLMSCSPPSCDAVVRRALEAAASGPGPGDLAMPRLGDGNSAFDRSLNFDHRLAASAPQGRIASPTRPGWRLLAAAALLLFSLGVAWMAWVTVMGDSAPPRLTAAEFYHRKVSTGWKPSWVCRDNQEFADTFTQRMGQPLMIATLPAGLAAGGIDYGDVVTPQSIAVLGAADDQKILILVTRRDSDFRPPSSMDNLRIFRREIGEFIMYEVTPLSESRLLEHFYLPQA